MAAQTVDESGRRRIRNESVHSVSGAPVRQPPTGIGPRRSRSFAGALLALAAGAALASALAGCGKSAEPAPKLYGREREALDRAKAVEGQVMQQAEDRKKQIEEAEKQ